MTSINMGLFYINIAWLNATQSIWDKEQNKVCDASICRTNDMFTKKETVQQTTARKSSQSTVYTQVAALVLQKAQHKRIYDQQKCMQRIGFSKQIDWKAQKLIMIHWQKAANTCTPATILRCLEWVQRSRWRQQPSCRLQQFHIDK